MIDEAEFFWFMSASPLFNVIATTVRKLLCFNALIKHARSIVKIMECDFRVQFREVKKSVDGIKRLISFLTKAALQPKKHQRRTNYYSHC